MIFKTTASSEIYFKKVFRRKISLAFSEKKNNFSATKRASRRKRASVLFKIDFRICYYNIICKFMALTKKISIKFILLTLILLSAGFFRFWRIAEMPPGLYPDEAMNGNNALEALHNHDFKVFYPENNGREGLFINIQSVTVAIFGNEPWVLRLVSGIFGFFTVLGLYFLIGELFYDKNKDEKYRYRIFKHNFSKSEVLALISSYLLAVSFWHINFSRIGFRAIMAPFFLVWSFYFLFLFFRKHKFSVLFLSGFIYGLGFHSYIAYRATPILIFLVFFYFWLRQPEERKKIFIYAIVFFAFAVAAMSPLLVYFYKNPQDFLGRTSQVSIFSSEKPLVLLAENIVKTIGMFWYRGDLNFRHNFAGEPQLVWPVGIFFALGIIIYIFRIFKSRINHNNQNIENLNIENSVKIVDCKLKINKFILPELLLLSWIIIGLLPVVISSEGIPHALRAIIIIPPVITISAAGIESFAFFIKLWLNRQKEKFGDLSKKIIRIKKEAVFFLFVFFLFLAGHAFNLYFLRFASRPEVLDAFAENYVKLGRYINTLSNDIPKYIVVNANGTDARGYPMPVQTTMFITKTFLPEWREEHNIHYITPDETDDIFCENSCVITFLENDPLLRTRIKEKIPDLSLGVGYDFVFLKK